MDKVQLGTSDLMVSKVCLGTMTFGEQNTEADGHSQLDYALEHGVNFIDTAEVYPVMPRAETQGATERIIGMSQYVTNPDKSSCEFSIMVGDDFGGKGLGSRLMLSIMEEARDKGLKEIDGLVLANNQNMLALMRKLGFTIQKFVEDEDFKLCSHKL